MTEPIGIDALEAGARKGLYEDSETILELIAELRQERERADKAVNEATGVRVDRDQFRYEASFIPGLQAELARAREVIEKAHAPNVSDRPETDISPAQMSVNEPSDVTLGIMAQRFYEAYGLSVPMTSKPQIVAGLRAALRASGSVEQEKS